LSPAQSPTDASIRALSNGSILMQIVAADVAVSDNYLGRKIPIVA
jgi:hypothetical protein